MQLRSQVAVALATAPIRPQPGKLHIPWEQKDIKTKKKKNSLKKKSIYIATEQLREVIDRAIMKALLTLFLG